MTIDNTIKLCYNSDMTKQIPLTQNQIALVDDDDYERINKFKWRANWSRGLFYATTKQNSIMMHNEVLNFVRHDGLEIDHINRHSLDNRKENLRICTHAENCRNQKPYERIYNPLKASHCSQGHEFTPENTYTHKKSGKRRCKICRSIYKKNYYAI